MDQMPDARFPGEPRDSCGSCYVDGLEGLLPALPIETHGVYDALDSCHSSGNGAIIVDVGMDRLNVELNVGEKLCSAFWMPRCAPAWRRPKAELGRAWSTALRLSEPYSVAFVR
jgi:hypothetical protein